MNKYLTILLVLLTATGSEAQTLTSALSRQCGNMKFEQMLTPEQIRAMGSDIMSVLKVLQTNADNEKIHPFYNNNFLSAAFQTTDMPLGNSSTTVWPKPKDTRLVFTKSSVSIRAPSK